MTSETKKKTSEYQKSTRQALISVSDRDGLIEFANFLLRQKVRLIATTSTANYLQEHNIAVTEIADYTGFPSIMGGRVKTLHHKIYGGILARPKQDQEVMAQHAITAIDLVIVNFYPFQQTIEQGCTTSEAIEQIDIGGPCLVRAAAKNYLKVIVLTDPRDYPMVTQVLTKHSFNLPSEIQFNLAHKAFNTTAYYDSIIQQYFKQHMKKDTQPLASPEYLTLPFTKKQNLRYGENPHQCARVYQDPLSTTAYPSLIHSIQHQGRALSFNNLSDGDTALNCVIQWDEQRACVIVKHATPCGVAIAKTASEAYQAALSTDRQAAFGGIIAFNSTIDADIAEAILAQPFTELVIAPEVTQAALTLLAHKPNLRVLSYGKLPKSSDARPAYQYRSIRGGLLAQSADNITDLPQDWKLLTTQHPNTQNYADLEFAWKVVRLTKSNAIVCAKNGQTYGIGTGQVSRVESVQMALRKAKEAKFDIRGAVLASDAFFPFRDAIDLAARAGIIAIVQTGGSKRDAEVIAAANEASIAMLSTAKRHFLH